MKEKYIIGPVLFDEYEELYYCKVGLNDKKMTLVYTVWGKNQKEIESAISKIL